jgi:hypothetical protein
LLYAELRRDSAEFIQIQVFTAPRGGKCFERYVEAHLVSESEAVSNSASDAIDTDDLAFDAMFLDAKIENGRRHVYRSKRQRRNTRHARAARDGDPDLSRELRSDVVESERGDEANHRPGHGSCGNR